MATNQNNNLNNTDTSSANTGGISVSGQSQGPVPATERIRQAREQIYQTLATDKFTFDEFSAVLDDSEVSGQLIQKLVENEKLSGWTSESLQGALFEGKLNEVSSEGSETTSATSTEPAVPSQSSSLDEATLAEQSSGLETPEALSQDQIPTGFRDAGGGTLIPEVQVQGTWREPFKGDWAYDIYGYEVYTPTPKAVADAGGWDVLSNFFREQQPNTLLSRPIRAGEPGEVVMEFGSRFINEDTAQPINLDALAKERELSQKPFEQWDKDDQMDFFVTRIAQMNISAGTAPTEDPRNAMVEQQGTERKQEDKNAFEHIADEVGLQLRNIGRESTRLGLNFLNIPEFVYDALSNITGAPTFQETFGGKLLQGFQDYANGAITRDELYNSSRFSTDGVIESFEKGNIANGVRSLVNVTASSLPIMVSLTSGNAMAAASTLSMGSGQYSTLQQENPDMDLASKMINSTLTMYAEMIPEKIGADAVFKPFYELYKKSGREVAENALSSFLRKVGGRFGVITPSATEFATEATTQVLNNAIAKYSGQDPERKINQDVLEAAVGGGFSGGLIASPAQIANSIASKGNKSRIQGLVQENMDIEVFLNDRELPDDVRQILVERYTNNIDEVNQSIEAEIEAKGRLSNSQKQEVSRLEASRERVNYLVGNESVPESVRANAQVEVDQINSEIEQIIQQDENIEGSGQVPVEDGQVAPVAEEAGATQELVETTPAEVPAGSRLFSEPVAGLTDLSTQYKTNNSINTPEGQPIRRLDRDRSARIADAYEAMEHNPNDPQVRDSYEAMATETLQQFETIQEAGYTVELWDGQGEPYANSTAMLDDLRNNKHLYVLPTEAEFGETPITDQQRQENPLLRDSGITDANGRRMLINDVFRFVHDVFGHGERGNSFGALGEENAWDVHARMYSDTARRAMTTETRGQNSWVNFGPHLRNAEGQVPRRGEEGFTPVTERPFAEQKIGLLPEEFSQLEEVAAPVQQNEVLTENEQSGIVNAIGEIDGVQDTPGLVNSVISNIADTSRRKARISELANNLRENIRQDENLGISQDNRAKARRDLEFLRDLTEYAVLNIADGVVTSAESFKEMARGLGDFGDAVLDRAYYAASRVAGEYAATNSETTDTAIGEVLTRIQDSSLDRTPAQTRVTSRQVRELTDGGTRGRVVQTMRVAIRDYYATLQRGARIGTKAQRDRARAFNKNLRDTLTEYYKTAPVSLTKAMTRSDLNRLTRKIAVAETDAHLEQIMDSLDKLTSKAENVARFESLKRLKAKSKSRSKSTLLPANVREPFGRFASMDPLELMRYLDDNSVSNLITLLTEIDASVKQGEPNRSMIGSISEVNNILKNLGNRLEKARFERELPKMEAHLEELSEASGMEYETPTTFSEYNVAVQDMEAELIRQGKSAPRTKSTARTNNERTVLNNLPMLDEVNLEDYTDNEVAAIDAIKSLTRPILEKLSDADVMKLSMVIPNLLGNERLDGVGSVAYKIKSYQLAADDSFTQPVRKALLDVPALGSFFMRFFSNPSSFNRAMRTFMSDSQRFDSLFRDVFTKGKFLGKFGIEQYKQGKNVAQRRYESSQDRFGVMARKDKDVKAFMNSSNRGEREALLGIYAWANQHQTGLTENQQQQLFERKMETLRGMVASMTGDTNRFDWLTRETLKASIDNTISAIERAVEAKNIGELRGMLGAGEMKVYNFALNEFASLRPEFLANARLYNNVDLDTNIDNYTPISYQFFDDKASDAFLETSYDRAYSTTKITGQSGSRSSKDRIIKDGTLPRDGILDFSFIGNTFKDIGLQLADIHTQGPRMQIHHNLNNNDLKQAVNGSNFFGTIQAMMTEDMRTNYSYFSSPRAMTIARKLMRAYSDSVYGRALGGLTQAIKQWIPTATDVLVRTGDPRTFFTYFNPANKQYRGDVGAFIANSDIARRGVQSSQMGQSVLNNVDVGEIRNKALRGVDKVLDVHHDVINKGVLAGLRVGDVEAAKAAWITYYKQYADRNGIPVDLSAAPNPEAAAFADNQVDITANTSVDAGKAKFTQSMIAKALIPFSGAAFTSLMNLSVSTSKWMTAMRIGDGPAARENMNAMVANILTITMFQMTGWGIRWASYYGLKAIGKYAIDAIDLDDEEEEENLKEVLNLTLDDYVKKRVERNIENSSYYLVNDLIHRGLLSQGPLESAADAIIKPAFEKVTGFNISTYRSTDPAEALFNTMGLYGILPAGIHSMFTKNSGLFSTREDELRHSGYGSYLTAEGEVEYDLPEGRNMPQELRTFNKTMQLLSIPAAFGIQDQFTSSITRTSPALYRQLEKEIFKGVPKASKASREKAFENKFNNLNHKGKTMKLDNKEAKLFRKYYDQTYKEEYEKYRESRLPFIGDGPKMEELAMKHIYKLTKDKLMADTEFKKLWDVKAEKSNK